MNLRGHLTRTGYLKAAVLLGIGAACGMLVLGVLGLWPRARTRSLTGPLRYLESRQDRGSQYDRGSDVETREARLATLALADQNKVLRQEVLELEEQIRQLTVAFASARVESDQLRLQMDHAELGVDGLSVPSGLLAKDEIGIVDVNRSLRMVVIDAGVLRGVRPGMGFDVLREGRYVARLRAVDVRDTVTGAVIEDMEMQRPPIQGDRVIPQRASEH